MDEADVSNGEGVEGPTKSGLRMLPLLIVGVAVVALLLGAISVARRKAAGGVPEKKTQRLPRDVVYIALANDAFFVPVGQTGQREQLEYELAASVRSKYREPAEKAIEGKQAKLREQIRTIILEQEYVRLANSQKQAMAEVRTKILDLLKRQLPGVQFYDLAFNKWYLP